MADNRSFVFMYRTASLLLLIAGVVLRTHAQQTPHAQLAANGPVLVVSEIGNFKFTTASSSRNSSISPSSSSDAADLIDLKAATLRTSQPPPRRYGRPSYSDRNSNPDGSPKYTFFAGVGGGVPIGNTHAYETPNYGVQAGAGRNFNQNFGVALQFDYDHFGLQAATLTNQTYVYNYCTTAVISAGQCPAPIAGLDGNNHVWSFTLNPTFPLVTQGVLGAYVVVGGGFYHKVTNFSMPATAEQCGIYGCGFFNVDQTIAHYTSNAGGANGGIGLTCKFSKFSNGQIYLETRYVVILNQQRAGYTAQNVATTMYTGYNAYPANTHRTTYIPIKFGIRF